MSSLFCYSVLEKIKHNFSVYSDCVSFVIADKSYTYEDLHRYVKSIARLLPNNSKNGEPVGLVYNDDIQTYASILALWFKGFSYVPLHSLQPIARNKEIISQTRMKLVLDSSNESKYDNLIEVIKTKNIINNVNEDVEINFIEDDALAYILFTSGSTGKPKGVQLSRLNLASFAESFQKIIKITSNDRCLQNFDLTFDVSVQCYLIPLLNGGCVYTVPLNEVKYVYVADLIEREKLTFAALPPSLVRFLKPYLEEINWGSLNQCILTAEASKIENVEALSRIAPRANIFNFYGPTEATIYCTYYKLNDNIKNHSGLISIGKPFDGVDAIIIDENGKQVEVGEKGELCVAGKQLTPGYWDNPEKNAEVFAFMNYNGTEKRFYHTGDLCYFDTDGDIQCLGRIDFQAKIQGFRVELGEIEYFISKYSKCETVVVAIKNNTGDDQLVAFIQSDIIPQNNIINYLKQHLPSYMIPGRYVFVTDFPLNQNGKVDRKVLINNL